MPQTRSPGVIEAQVGDMLRQVLHRHAELERAKIQISVEGSTVTLTGKVETWREQDLAEKAAWSTPGVTAVVNRLEIG